MCGQCNTWLDVPLTSFCCQSNHFLLKELQSNNVSVEFVITRVGITDEDVVGSEDTSTKPEPLNVIAEVATQLQLEAAVALESYLSIDSVLY